MLEIEGINAYYGDLQALWGISLQVNEGELVALIGPNGAGKTTTLRVITGLMKPASGSVRFQRSAAGQDRGAQDCRAGHLAGARRRQCLYGDERPGESGTGRVRRQRASKVKDQSLKWVYQIFPRLEERKNQRAGTLSGGERQMLAIGRALMSKPKLLMLDEPSFGLAPILVQQMFEMIKEINRQGVTILLVEQNVRAALELAHRAYVIENGRIVGQGSGRESLVL